ncbi:hypothetical protein R4Y59_002742 [Enterococcus faecalis]|nr:hypothetical protein [Enterococcus faecalis]
MWKWLSDKNYELEGHFVAAILIFRGGLGSSEDGKLFYSEGPSFIFPSRDELNKIELPTTKEQAKKAMISDQLRLRKQHIDW